jgi:hypothetical protein
MGRAIVNIIIEQWVKDKNNLYIVLSKEYRLNDNLNYHTVTESFIENVKEIEFLGDFEKLKENPTFKVLTEEEYEKWHYPMTLSEITEYIDHLSVKFIKYKLGCNGSTLEIFNKVFNKELIEIGIIDQES